MSTAIVGVTVGVTLCAVGVLIIWIVERRRDRAQRVRMHEARLKAMRLVVEFEHTPVRGASRDRSVSGKARRQARRS